ncbi:MAG: HPr kinase/phosphorylase [Spirochaetes bacterium]|nr:HPr kinase/phosphorylase [Spirochaetota bacterium]
MKQKIFIRDLLDLPGDIDLRLTALTGEIGLDKEIEVADVNRPGLTLSGFYDFFASDRIQIFGKGENAYLDSLSSADAEKSLAKFFEYDVFCCVFTHNVFPSKMFIDLARKKNIPVMVTELNTTQFISQVTHIVEEAQAPVVSIHGTLADVYGFGCLIMGKSGVGKSETALELIERGHRLVADDIVEIKRIEDSMLVGQGSPIIKHHIEIRGLGIINVREVFGIRSVRNSKRIEIIVTLEEWDSNKSYDRLGIDEKHFSILGIDVPHIVIPVRPGRNIPVIVETAALNQRLKKMGVHSARELDKRLQDWMKMESNRNG